MKRIVLGTSALGSLVPQQEAEKILHEACALGINHFDTAPQYGSGYACKLLANLADSNITISTKFGSAWGSLPRFCLKRLYRMTSISNLLTGMPPYYSNHLRENRDWWTFAIQQPFIEKALSQLGHCRPGYIFMHSPPLLPEQDQLTALRTGIHALGAGFGVCSPRKEDLSLLLQRPDAVDCIQLHLDDVLALEPLELQQLSARKVLVHGVYSPSAEARYTTAAEREAACVELASGSASLSFVIGSKTVAGLTRLARFAEKLP